MTLSWCNSTTKGCIVSLAARGRLKNVTGPKNTHKKKKKKNQKPAVAMWQKGEETWHEANTALTHLPYLTYVHNGAFSFRLFKCIFFCLQSYKSLITFLLCPPPLLPSPPESFLLHFGTSDRKTLSLTATLTEFASRSRAIWKQWTPAERDQECRTLSAVVNWSHPTKELVTAASTQFSLLGRLSQPTRVLESLSRESSKTSRNSLTMASLLL